MLARLGFTTVDLMFAVPGALVASGFAIDLWVGHVRRPRPHAAAWAAGMSMFAAATWALVAGLAAGWTDTSFRVFFYFGAIANIPVLALGSVYLSLGARAGRRTRVIVIVFLAAGAWITMTAVPVAPFADTGVPEGSEVFELPVNEIGGGVELPSPRLFAAIAGGVGSITIIALSAWSVLKTWGSVQRVALGNVLIILGVLAPATGGSLTALGEGAGLALSLLVGAVLLWLGYRVATGRRFVSGEAAPQLPE